MNGLRTGQLVDPAERFCPLRAVSGFPHQFMKQNENDKNIVAERFFDGGLFRARGWNVFYLRSFQDDEKKLLLFIPTREVEQLFEDIRVQTGIHVSFPDAVKRPGFQVDFDLDGIPRPRYLGRFNSTNSVQDLQKILPEDGSAFEEPIEIDPRSLPAFRQRLQTAIEVVKPDKRLLKEKKRKSRLQQKEKWCNELRRAQCYLGVRDRVPGHIDEISSDPNMTWEESQDQQRASGRLPETGLPDVDIAQPAPYPFHLNPIFVCIDIEVWERDWSKLTEIGVSTLDTSDIIHLSPGHQGENWMKEIRYRHFRVMEYYDKVNSRFVSGCPDKFMPEFGTSEWISIKELPQVVAGCLREPFSKPGMYQPYPYRMDEVSRFGSNIQPLVNPNSVQKRNIILAGHEFKSDIRYLRSAGCNLYNLSNVVEVIDTANLYRAWKHDNNSSSLGNVLLDLDRVGWHLHNAGNDAAYTLQALIAISIVTLDPTNQASALVDPEKLAKVKQDEQRQFLIEDKEEWLNAVENVGDGGQPLSLKSLELEEQVKQAQKAGKADAKKEQEQKNPASQVGNNPPGKQSHRGGGLGLQRGGVKLPSHQHPLRPQQQQTFHQHTGFHNHDYQQRGNNTRGRGGAPQRARGQGAGRGGRGRGRGGAVAQPSDSLPKPQPQPQPMYVIDDDAEYGM